MGFWAPHYGSFRVHVQSSGFVTPHLFNAQNFKSPTTYLLQKNRVKLEISEICNFRSTCCNQSVLANNSSPLFPEKEWY